jgi:alpha-L-fucosidase 2
MTPSSAPQTLRLSWRSPARHWEEATPLGNGRIGAMAFGGAAGRYALNDSTLWSGTPDGPATALRDVVAGGAGPERLAEIRAALDSADVRTAERLVMTFQGPYSQEFLPLGDLSVRVAGAGEGPPPHDLDKANITAEVKPPGR